MHFVITVMIYLIVPPIIVIIAVAVLIIFLTKLFAAERGDAGNFVLREKRGIKKHLTSGREYLRGASENASHKIKERLNNINGTKKTHEIVMESHSDHIISLRKKSMVSDKIGDGETRDPEELSLMKEIENDAQNSKKYEQLGDYYMEHEQFADARECYKYVLRLDPHHKRAQVAMKNLDRVL